MKKNFMKKTLAVALTAAVLAPASFVEAAQFKDVSANHWAYQFIEDMSDQGVIKGYVDKTYKPERQVQFLEVLNLIKGVINPSADDLANARAKYGADVKELKVPEWAEDAVLTALEKDVLSLDKLKEAKDAGMVSYQPTRIPDRSSVAVYYARALNLDKKEDTSKLKYNDMDKINKDVKEYLAALVDAGIFEATGADGNFQGDRGIRRDEMAKITYLSYEYNKSAKESKTYKGKVYFVADAAGVNEFIVENGNEHKTFNMDKDTEFFVNDKAGKKEDLAAGQEVTVTYKEVSENLQPSGRLASKVEIKKTDSSIYGKLYDLGATSRTISLKYTDKKSDVNLKTGSIKLDSDKVELFKIPEDAKVTIYGKDAKLTDIKKNDIVEIKSVNDEIKEVKVYPENGYVEGKVTKVSSSNGEITLKLDNDEEETFYVSRSSFDFPKEGDKVNYKLNFLEIQNKKLEKNSYVGTLKDYREPGLNSDGKIQLVFADSSDKIFDLDMDAKVYEGSDSLGNIPNLKDGLDKAKDKYVKISLEDGKVTKIEILKKDLYKLNGDVIINSVKHIRNTSKYKITAKVYRDGTGNEADEFYFTLSELESSIPAQDTRHKMVGFVEQDGELFDLYNTEFLGN